MFSGAFKPLFAVIEVLAGIAIVTAEKGAPHATCGAMIVGCVVKTDLLTPCYGHVEPFPGITST